jgi:arsenate reductase (glutaredoxin)
VVGRKRFETPVTLSGFMQAIKIYHNPRCSKSRETLQLLKKKKAEMEIVEYLKSPPSEKELRSILNKLGLEAEALVRKKEPLFIEKFSKKKYTGMQWIKILAKNPVLIERPIVVKGNKAVVGRPPEKALSILK